MAASWTYDADLSKPKDRVRFLIQDTDTNRQLFQDQEIIWELSQEVNIYMTAARLCDIMAAKTRSLRSKSVGGLSLTWTTETWEGVAAKLRLRGSTYQLPTAGGVLVDDRDAFWEDSDLLRPSFFGEVHANPDALTVTRVKSEEESS